jgi:G:T-mismatch repair DNA endonuclease (very short patch repair protein)
MSEIEKFMSLDFDRELLSKSPNNHSRRKYIREYVRGLITKDLLWEIFENKKYTVNQAQHEIFIPTLGTMIWILHDLCKEYGIVLPDASESAKRSMKRKYATNIKRYGGTGNILSKGSIKVEKKNTTVSQRYGVENVFQSDEIKEKIEKVNISRYGVKNSGILFGKFRNLSKPHKKVSDYLESLGFVHENEIRCRFMKFNENMNKVYSPIPDILIEDKKIVIEIYGDFWHCNPVKYKAMDIIESRLRYGNEKYAKDVWDADRIREAHISSFGYRVIVIWETDIKNEKYKEVINELFGNRENNQD